MLVELAACWRIIEFRYTALVCGDLPDKREGYHDGDTANNSRVGNGRKAIFLDGASFADVITPNALTLHFVFRLNRQTRVGGVSRGQVAGQITP